MLYSMPVEDRFASVVLKKNRNKASATAVITFWKSVNHYQKQDATDSAKITKTVLLPHKDVCPAKLNIEYIRFIVLESYKLYLFSQATIDKGGQDEKRNVL